MFRNCLFDILLFGFCSVSCLLVLRPCHADSFGTGENQFDIEFVPIGQPGNGPDTSHNIPTIGPVSYGYGIAKFEISEQMITKANASTAGGVNPLDLTIDTRGPNKPATSVTWFEAARFVNWLNTSSGHTPAYKFNAGPSSGDEMFQFWEPGDAGYDANNESRNSFTRYVLPSLDEWYKAGFYDPALASYFEHANGSDLPPIPVASGDAFNTAVYEQDQNLGPADVLMAGGMSPYGTAGQSGNVDEWMETDVGTVLGIVSDDRISFGGSWRSIAGSIDFESIRVITPDTARASIGFRVVAVPEPHDLVMALGLMLIFAVNRRG